MEVAGGFRSIVWRFIPFLFWR